MKRFIYFAAITMPLFLALTVFQSNRFKDLKYDLDRLEQSQTNMVNDNKRLIADIAQLSSPERIANIAEEYLDLQKIRPENVLLIKIEEGKGHEF